MKVLLVDDEQKFALMLAKRLSLRGFQTDVFFAGEQALKRSTRRADATRSVSWTSRCRESAASNWADASRPWTRR